MLVPKDDDFTNPDQFHVDIGVFGNDGTKLDEWLNKNASPGGAKPKTSSVKIHGQEAYRYEVNYGENEVRLAYVINAKNYLVLIKANFFNGDNYSYKGSKNYLTFVPEVDRLAESLKVRD